MRGAAAPTMAVLEGKIALITGASRGIGKAIAIGLAREGADVVCAARSTASKPHQRIPGTLDETVAAVQAEGRRALAIATDVSVPAQVQAMVREALDTFGRIDILVNNAAVAAPTDIWSVSAKSHDLMMAVNVRGPLLAMQAVAHGMRERAGGTILNVLSAAALNVFPGLMSYGASKLALERLSLDVAAQLRPFGIAVNGYRVDLPVASEGLIARSPAADHATSEPPEVAAEGAIWLLRQPPSFTGRLVGMKELRDREGIMASRAREPYTAELGRRWSWTDTA